MKGFLKMFFKNKLESIVIDLLRALAKRSTNNVDDQLIEMVIRALQNKSYKQVLRRKK